jgi:hypothetical protein
MQSSIVLAGAIPVVLRFWGLQTGSTKYYSAKVRLATLHLLEDMVCSFFFFLSFIFFFLLLLLFFLSFSFFYFFLFSFLFFFFFFISVFFPGYILLIFF